MSSFKQINNLKPVFVKDIDQAFNKCSLEGGLVWLVEEKEDKSISGRKRKQAEYGINRFSNPQELFNRYDNMEGCPYHIVAHTGCNICEKK